MPVKPDRPLAAPQPTPYVPRGQQVPAQQPQMWAYWEQPAEVKPTPAGWQNLIFLALGGGLVVLVAALVVLVLVLVLFMRNDRIMPGVHVEGIALGGYSTAEAVQILQTEWQ